MKITVQLQSVRGLGGEPLCTTLWALTIPSDCRVDDIKQDIGRRLDGMVDIELAMDDKLLIGNHNLKEAGIRHGSEIQLILQNHALVINSDDESGDDGVPLHKQCIGCEKYNINWQSTSNCRACAAQQALELDRYAEAQQRRR